MMHIVLVEPEIHTNAGNIARTCAATGAHLHFVKPLGFSLEDRYLKRAGLDYWPYVKLTVHESLLDLERFLGETPRYYLSTKGRKTYSEVGYPADVALYFGKETAGLPKELLEAHPDRVLRLPMGQEIRSLNLGNTVAVVMYEALRQQGFPGLI